MSLAITCQFLCIVAVNSLPVCEKGVIMGRMFITVYVRLDNKLLQLWVKAFFIFLMIRCSGYVPARRMRVRSLSSSCRMWSSEMTMLYRSACE